MFGSDGPRADFPRHESLPDDFQAAAINGTVSREADAIQGDSEWTAVTEGREVPKGGTMRKSILAGCMVTLLGFSPAFAQQAYYTAGPNADPISAMESSLTEARTTIHGHGGNGCDPCCAPRKCGPTINVGVEATYLRPDFDANEADPFLGGGVFNYEYEAAPRVWVGVEGASGFGIRARYWDYDAESSFHFVDIDTEEADFVSVSSAAAFDVYHIDIELTRRCCVAGWSTLGSFGVRHTGMSFQAQAEIVYDGISADLDVTMTFLGHRFDGTGLTFAMEGRKPVGRSRLALYWNARGSVLWGDHKAAGLDYNVDVDNGEFSVDTDADLVREDDEMWILEAQVGLEYTHALKCGGIAFARGAFEYQDYNFSDFAPAVVGDFDAFRDDFDMYGFSFAVGISR